MININTVATVSKDRDSRQAIRDISKSPDRKVVAVDFYAWQASSGAKDYRGNDIPAYNFSATFFGKTAETVLKYFTPGETSVQISGEQLITYSESGDRTYTNIELKNASFNFLPRSSESSGSDSGSGGVTMG